MDFLKHLLVAAALFVAIDSLWIKYVANSFYKKKLKSLLADKPSFGPAIVFYLIYMIGIVVFVVDPAHIRDSLSFALGHGALLGLVMYATYDLTNQSTLKNWPSTVTYVDMAWGTFVTGLVSTLVFIIFR
jgi:uncharacterized membrane protein